MASGIAGAWDCAGGVGFPGAPSGSLQGNASGVFAGVPGSTADFNDGPITLSPTAGVPLTLTGTPGNDSLDLYTYGNSGRMAFASISGGKEIQIAEGNSSTGNNISLAPSAFQMYDTGGDSVLIHPVGITLAPLGIPCASGTYVEANGTGCANPFTGTQYAIVTCGNMGLGDGFNAIPADTYIQYDCTNKSGVTRTITGIFCYTDNAGTSSLSATNNAGSALLTGSITCGNTKTGGGTAGTLAITTLANNDAINFSFVADGTTKTTTWVVSMTQ